MQYVSRDGQVIDVPAGGQVPSGFIPVGSGMSGGQSSGGADINVGNNAGLKADPGSGTMIGVNAPEGFRRHWAGLRDLFHGDRDFDQRGHGGGRKSDQGFGGPIEGYEVQVGGNVQKLPDKTTEKDPSFDDMYGMPFQDYLNKMEGIQDRAANKKMLRGQIASIPDLMSAGNLAIAQANRDIAKASSEWGVALTKQKPWEAIQAWSPKNQFDYKLGS